MGTTNVSFDQGAQQANERLMQRQQISQQQRAEHQNTVGALLMDAINQSSNIKPTMKDENGNVVPNPAYEQAQQDRRNLLQQYVTLNSPEQHATFADRLHGLIFGHPTDHQREPALNPASSAPPAPGAQGQAPAVSPPATPAPPPHPFSAAPHPVLAKFDEAVKGLGNHLKAFAHPLPAQAQPDADLIGKYYRDPAEIQAERNLAMWQERGQNALEVARERTKALTASLNARPPRMLSQTTVPNLLEQLKIDPDQVIYGPNGQEISPAQLAEMPPGTIAREFRAGSNVFYALGDQNSKTIAVGNQVYQIPSVGQIQGNMTALGVKNPGSTSSSTDAFGTTTTSTHTVPTPGAIAAPQAPSGPVLQKRPALSDVNASIAAANAASPKLNKGKPISAVAPSVPSSLPPLDNDGHIPAGAVNDLVRQYANDLLDGRDAKDIPNPRARAAAEALAGRYGWSQGAFTPKEKVQFQVATDFLKQLKDSDSLKVLDNYVSREKIFRAMRDPNKMSFIDRIAAYNLNPKEAEFVRLFNASRGTVAGLSSITRPGRATNSQVQAIANELPNVFQSSSSQDAKDRVDQLLKEADIALHTNPTKVGKPVSKNAPTVNAWKPPADAPPAPKEDGKFLKADGKVIAVSKGGQWAQP